MVDEDQILPLSIAAVLVALSGLFSGLNLGLMSFTPDDLLIVIDGSEDPHEVKNAKAILRVRKRGNLLLCTLLLGNTLVNAMIAILLADVASGLVGGLVTTALIVVFGEIIPQSVCSRHALAIGAKSIPIVWLCIIICAPVAFPISLILDYLLGREMGGIYTSRQLLTMVRMNLSDPERQKATGMTEGEGKLLAGALQYKNKIIAEVMTPLERVFTLTMDTKLDKDVFMKMLDRGHTRIPVAEANGKIGAILYCKDLLGVGYEKEMLVRDVVSAFHAERRLTRVPASMKAGDVFELCKKQHTHLCLVTDDPPADKLEAEMPIVGIVTMEDIIEEIIQDEIVGEHDEFIANSLSRRNISRSDPGILLRRMTNGGEDAAPLLPGEAEDFAE